MRELEINVVSLESQIMELIEKFESDNNAHIEKMELQMIPSRNEEAVHKHRTTYVSRNIHFDIRRQ